MKSTSRLASILANAEAAAAILKSSDSPDIVELNEYRERYSAG